jgi:hypothetical protein
LGLIESVQEIALVLAGIAALEQVLAPVAFLAPDVVAGGDKIGPQPPGMVQEGPELDFGVAQDVRIGRPTAAVLIQKIAEHPVLVLGGEVDLVQRDAQCFAHRPCVVQILGGGAVASIEGFLPVLHEHAMHVVALLDQQQGGDRGIHAARQADDDTGS